MRGDGQNVGEGIKNVRVLVIDDKPQLRYVGSQTAKPLFSKFH